MSYPIGFLGGKPLVGPPRPPQLQSQPASMRTNEGPSVHRNPSNHQSNESWLARCFQTYEDEQEKRQAAGLPPELPILRKWTSLPEELAAFEKSISLPQLDNEAQRTRNGDSDRWSLQRKIDPKLALMYVRHCNRLKRSQQNEELSELSAAPSSKPHEGNERDISALNKFASQSSASPSGSMLNGRILKAKKTQPMMPVFMVPENFMDTIPHEPFPGILIGDTRSLQSLYPTREPISRPKNTDSPYTCLNRQVKEIRLITLLPGSWSDPLRAEFTTVSLLSKPEYETLSYVWGDAQMVETITINNNHTMGLSLNLFCALKRLRSRTESRALWIDALCINMQDLEERGAQVGLMHKIYKDCSAVNVWMGEHRPQDTDSHNSKAIITLLELFASGVHLTQLPSSILPGYAHLGPAPLDSICDFVNLPWWTRAWVVQEAVLPPKIHVYYDCFRFPWKLLVIAADSIEKHRTTCCASEVDMIGLADYMPYLVKLSHTVRTLQSLRDLFQVEDKPEQPEISGKLSSQYGEEMRLQSNSTCSNLGVQHQTDGQVLSTFLSKFQSREATDHRDKIYAFLGLVGQISSTDLILPSYSVPVENVYEDTTVSIMKSAGSLQILLENENHGQRNYTNLPSWVPDWSESRTTDGYAQERLQTFELYRAGGTEPTTTQFGNGTLMLEALEFDTVKILADPMPEIFTVAEILTHRSWLGMIEDYYQSPQEQSPYSRRIPIQHYSSLALDKSYNEVSFEPSWYDAYWRTLCADVQFHGPGGYYPSQPTSAGKDCLNCVFDRIMKPLARRAMPRDFESVVQCWVSYIHSSIVAVPPDLISGGANISRDTSLSHTFRSIRTATLGRRLFITQRGYLGLGPQDMRSGDMVAVIPGLSVPLILRRATAFDCDSPIEQQTREQGSTHDHGQPRTTNASSRVKENGKEKEKEKTDWKLIGPSYLHGIMDGEALALDGLTRKKIIIC